MAKVPEFYQVGDRESMTIERLLVIVEDMYRDLAINLNKKPDVYQRNTNGLMTDTFMSNGDININLTTNTVEMLTNHPTSTTVTWTLIS